MKSAFKRAAIATLAVAGVAHGQAIRASQLATVSQLIADTRIEITYRRPVARGRELFGALVPYGRVWSPSSDTAAIMTISRPMQVNGQPLAAGKYSIWTIPDRDSWTIIFSSIAPQFHMRYPGGDVLRVTTTPVAGDHMESLAFYFPMVDGDSARLVLHWGRTVVPLDLKAK